VWEGYTWDMRIIIWGLLCAMGLGMAGCKEESAPNRVVLYTAIDRPYAEAIVAEFEAQTGIDVELTTDDEGSKTAGLTARLLAEKDNARADVWWSNEIFHTLRLAQAGVLQPYEPAVASEIGEAWRPESKLYTPVALRARVLVVNTDPAHAELVKDVDSLEDLLDPKLKGKIAIANPRFGTTGGHVASLYQSIADEGKADAFFKALHDNGVAVLGSNSEVVRHVASGQVLVGLTDNDDVYNAQGDPVKMVVPNQADGGRGTLLIPTTIALVKGAPHPENAKKLIDYLSSKAVEQKLIETGFAAYSVRDSAGAVQTMAVDFSAAAESLQERSQRAEKLMRGE
jgi:iron(III) transport system substrate-binding protein